MTAWFQRLAARFQCLGRHRWERVSTQPGGVGFMDECQKCGRGRYLAFLGLATTTGTRSAEEMKQWRREVDGDGQAEEEGQS